MRNRGVVGLLAGIMLLAGDAPRADTKITAIGLGEVPAAVWGVIEAPLARQKWQIKKSNWFFYQNSLGNRGVLMGLGRQPDWKEGEKSFLIVDLKGQVVFASKRFNGGSEIKGVLDFDRDGSGDAVADWIDGKIRYRTLLRDEGGRFRPVFEQRSDGRTDLFSLADPDRDGVYEVIVEESDVKRSDAFREKDRCYAWDAALADWAARDVSDTSGLSRLCNWTSRYEIYGWDRKSEKFEKVTSGQVEFHAWLRDRYAEKLAFFDSGAGVIDPGKGYEEDVARVQKLLRSRYIPSLDHLMVEK